MSVGYAWTYRIAENFRGRKLSQISRFCGYMRKFSLRNLGCGVIWRCKSEQSTKVFSAKIVFSLIRESFLPQKFTVPEANSTTMRDLHCLWAACSCLSWSAVAVRALTSAVFVPWVSFTPTLFSGSSPSRARQWTVHIARTKLHSVFMKYLNAFI